MPPKEKIMITAEIPKEPPLTLKQRKALAKALKSAAETFVATAALSGKISVVTLDELLK